MNELEVVHLFDTCSNRGRWGPSDEAGTLNFITPERRIAAARLVRTGRVVSIGRDLEVEGSPTNPTPVVLKVWKLGEPTALAVIDSIEVTAHGLAATHIDALGHVFFEGSAYNGRTIEECLSPAGLQFASVHGLRNGLFTRGVLLDVARARGVPWLEPHEGVLPDDLERAASIAGLTVEPGDAVVVRVGTQARESSGAAGDPSVRPGLEPECIAWLFEREVAVFAGDCVERIPQPFQRVPIPLHQVGIVAIGLIFLDGVDVEALREAVRTEGSHEFLLVAAPLRMPQATGSVVNPICLF